MRVCVCVCDTVTSLTALGLSGFAPPVCQCPLVAHELSAAAAGAAADSRLSALARTTTRLVTDESSSVTAYKDSWKEWGRGWGVSIAAERIFGIFRLRTRPEKLRSGMTYRLTYGMANRLTIGMANRLTTGMDYMYVIWCDAVAGGSSGEK